MTTVTDMNIHILYIYSNISIDWNSCWRWRERERSYFKFDFIILIIPKAPRCLWEGTTMADGLGMLQRYDSVSVGPDLQGPFRESTYDPFSLVDWFKQTGFFLSLLNHWWLSSTQGKSFQSTNRLSWTTLSPDQLRMKMLGPADHIPKDGSRRQSCKSGRCLM